MKSDRRGVSAYTFFKDFYLEKVKFWAEIKIHSNIFLNFGQIISFKDISLTNFSEKWILLSKKSQKRFLTQLSKPKIGQKSIKKLKLVPKSFLKNWNPLKKVYPDAPWRSSFNCFTKICLFFTYVCNFEARFSAILSIHEVKWSEVLNKMSKNFRILII